MLNKFLIISSMILSAILPIGALTDSKFPKFSFNYWISFVCILVADGLFEYTLFIALKLA